MGVQVSTATHDGEGNPLSAREKAFISFSYGGKNIEDFDFLSVTTGDRLERDISAEYEDTVSEKIGMDGQLYWNTNYKALSLHFDLATDGVDMRTLDKLIDWFKPGIERELILSEHPNRAIAARVASVPHYKLLPFEEHRNIAFGQNQHMITTTLYRGEMSIDFICDYPFWHIKEGGVSSYATMSSITDYALVYEDNILVRNSNITSPLFIPQDDSADNTYTFGKYNQAYIFYGGSADSYIKVNFDIGLIVDSNGIKYDGEVLEEAIVGEAIIGLSFVGLISGSTPTVNNILPPYYQNCACIAINCSNETTNSFLVFSLPDYFLSLNNMLINKIVNWTANTTTIVEVYDDIMDGTFNSRSRTDLLSIYNLYDNNSYVVDGKITQNFINNFKNDISALVPETITLTFDGIERKSSMNYTLNNEAVSERIDNALKTDYLKLIGTDYPSNSMTPRAEDCHLIQSTLDLKNACFFYNVLYK